MSREIIGIGTTANDGNGDPLRLAFTKCNGNFAELYSNTENVLAVAWAGTQAANEAYAIAVAGTNAADLAGDLAYHALQTAWSGTQGANSAFSVAVAGTNTAQQSSFIANRALQTAWSGTSGANAAMTVAVAGTNASRITGFSFVIDGGGATITTGLKGYVEIPFGFTVSRWTIVADQSGNIVVDVVKSNGYAGFPTAPSIAGTAKPTLSGAQKNQTTTLTGWTTGLNAGDLVGFNVQSVATVQNVTVALYGTRTP